MESPEIFRRLFMGDRPNILFIMSDDHAANSISIYKSRLASVFQTPNLDRIGREGAVIHNCFCENSICTPSRASILTGQHCHTNGVRTLADALSENSETFVDVLHRENYETAIIGKWHLHCEPRGFDYYSILADQGYYHDPYFISSGADWSQIDPLRSDQGERIPGYVTDIITEKTLDWLEHRNREKPFLLLCHHKAPHDNFEYTQRYEHLFDGIEIPEPDTLFEDKSHRSLGSRYYGSSVGNRFPLRNHVSNMIQDNYPTGKLELKTKDEKEITKAAYQKYLKDYLRTVKGIDDSVGAILNYLKMQGVLDDTIVIYTSDQGMMLGEHDYIDKRWIFEESMQMPMMIRYPKKIKSGSELFELISNVDIAPTILDMAQQAIPRQMQGKSFRRLLFNESKQPIRNCVYYRYWMHMAHHYVPAHYGIRTLEYKLIFFYGLPLDAYGAWPQPITPAGWELYDLRCDPYETKNVYNDPAYANIVKNMQAMLAEEKKRNGDTDQQFPELLNLLYNSTKNL